MDFARRLEDAAAAPPSPAGERAAPRTPPHPTPPLPRGRGGGGAHAHAVPYATPEAIWNEHRESTRGRDLDITGLSYALLEHSPQQWPFPEGATHGRARLYEDGVFPTPTARPASPTCSTSRWPSRAMRAIPSRSPPGACATSGTA